MAMARSELLSFGECESRLLRLPIDGGKIWEDLALTIEEYLWENGAEPLEIIKTARKFAKAVASEFKSPSLLKMGVKEKDAAAYLKHVREELTNLGVRESELETALRIITLNDLILLDLPQMIICALRGRGVIHGYVPIKYSLGKKEKIFQVSPVAVQMGIVKETDLMAFSLGGTDFVFEKKIYDKAVETMDILALDMERLFRFSEENGRGKGWMKELFQLGQVYLHEGEHSFAMAPTEADKKGVIILGIAQIESVDDIIVHEIDHSWYFREMLRRGHGFQSRTILELKADLSALEYAQAMGYEERAKIIGHRLANIIRAIDGDVCQLSMCGEWKQTLMLFEGVDLPEPWRGVLRAFGRVEVRK